MGYSSEFVPYETPEGWTPPPDEFAHLRALASGRGFEAQRRQALQDAGAITGRGLRTAAGSAAARGMAGSGSDAYGRALARKEGAGHIFTQAAEREKAMALAGSQLDMAEEQARQRRMQESQAGMQMMSSTFSMLADMNEVNASRDYADFQFLQLQALKEYEDTQDPRVFQKWAAYISGLGQD